MRPTTILHATLALLPLSMLSLAQTGPASKPVAVPAGAVAPRKEPRSIAMHVTGLTQANGAKVEQALKDLGTTLYSCKACKHEQTTPGKCPTCKSELAEGRREALASVSLSQDNSTVTVTPAPSGSVRLSEIEAALAKNSVHVDESKLTLPGNALLVLHGAAADNVAAIEKSLQTAKLFEEVHARFDAVHQELDIEVRAGAQAPMRSTVAKAIEDAATKARLADVQWGMPQRKT